MFEFDLLQKIKLKFDEYMLERLIKKLDRPCIIDITPLREKYKNINFKYNERLSKYTSI